MSISIQTFHSLEGKRVTTVTWLERIRGEEKRRYLVRALHSRLLLLGGVIVVAVVVLAFVGNLAPPHDPQAMSIARRTQPPSLSFPFGTDQYGRDIFSRILKGAGIALSVGWVAIAVGLVGGAPLGILSGYYGRWLDETLMRLMDALFAFPAILLALAMVAALGPGHRSAMLAIGLVNVPVFARLGRASTLSLKKTGFVEAARAVGSSDFRILRHHILPNSLAPLIVQATVSFASAILAEASLSYLGLGTQPPLPSWGKMLEEARGFMNIAPWMAIFPGLAIALTVLGFSFLGDGLRDFLDPYNSL
jgi:peptide/nickel transport system permease protein